MVVVRSDTSLPVPPEPPVLMGKDLSSSLRSSTRTVFPTPVPVETPMSFLYGPSVSSDRLGHGRSAVERVKTRTPLRITSDPP